MVKNHPKEYYESILQLRPYDKKILNYVKKRVEKRKDVFISKEVKLKKGIDLYLTSNKFALILGKKLKKAFKGEVKISRKLFSRNKLTSKRLWRVTVCFRLKTELV